MGSVLFKNKKVAKKYRIISEKDVNITIPERKDRKGYSGKLSAISDESVVKGMIERGSNLVAEAEASTSTKSNTGSTPAGGKESK